MTSHMYSETLRLRKYQLLATKDLFENPFNDLQFDLPFIAPIHIHGLIVDFASPVSAYTPTTKYHSAYQQGSPRSTIECDVVSRVNQLSMSYTWRNLRAIESEVLYNIQLAVQDTLGTVVRELVQKAVLDGQWSPTGLSAEAGYRCSARFRSGYLVDLVVASVLSTNNNNFNNYDEHMLPNLVLLYLSSCNCFKSTCAADDIGVEFVCREDFSTGALNAEVVTKLDYLSVQGIDHQVHEGDHLKIVPSYNWGMSWKPIEHHVHYELATPCAWLQWTGQAFEGFVPATTGSATGEYVSTTSSLRRNSIIDIKIKAISFERVGRVVLQRVLRTSVCFDVAARSLKRKASLETLEATHPYNKTSRMSPHSMTRGARNGIVGGWRRGVFRSVQEQESVQRARSSIPVYRFPATYEPNTLVGTLLDDSVGNGGLECSPSISRDGSMVAINPWTDPLAACCSISISKDDMVHENDTSTYSLAENCVTSSPKNEIVERVDSEAVTTECSILTKKIRSIERDNAHRDSLTAGIWATVPKARTTQSEDKGTGIVVEAGRLQRLPISMEFEQWDLRFFDGNVAPCMHRKPDSDAMTDGLCSEEVSDFETSSEESFSLQGDLDAETVVAKDEQDKVLQECRLAFSLL